MMHQGIHKRQSMTRTTWPVQDYLEQVRKQGVVGDKSNESQTQGLVKTYRTCMIQIVRQEVMVRGREEEKERNGKQYRRAFQPATSEASVR
jgi:hypothetical protein